MANVLISFLGTSNVKREYRSANYHFSNGDSFKTTFIAEALTQHYHVDKIILIGTAKSMWEEVYYSFAKKNGKEDADKYVAIGDKCVNASHLSDLEIPYKEDIENALGPGSKIILIKYGLNKDEILFNSSQIMSIEQFLDIGDRLIVDITHSFRSLPIMLMNCLVYLQNVSRKNIKIDHITYGMLDITNEMGGETPVVELNSLLELNDWISGAYSFSQFGNAYKIADLIESEDKSVAERLRRFSDLMNLNHIYEIQHEAQGLSAIKNMKYSSKIPEMILNPIINDFITEFHGIKTHSSFQYRLACWQNDHKKYCFAYITLQESIVTYICEQNGLQGSNYNNREQAKQNLRNESHDLRVIPELKNLYNKIKKTRNALAHSKQTSKNYKVMISDLSEYIKQLKDIII